MSRVFLSAFGATALLIGSSSVVVAQKGHGASHAEHSMPAHHAKTDHESAKAETREGPKSEAKEVKETKEAKRAEKTEDRAEKSMMRDAHEQSSRLLHGVKLTSAERRRVNEIDEKYEQQLKALKKDEHVADKAGTSTAVSDAAFAQKVAALSAQERTDIRAALPASQQARFDLNATALASMKH